MKRDKAKILLVDDDLDILEFIRYNLQKEGYTVFIASNGLDAIKISQKEAPDLIILDVMMPNMDGIETCIKIRETPGLNNTLIAFLTARNEDYSQIAGFEAGADDYIAKPIKPRVLLSRINALLRRQDHVNVSEISHGGMAGRLLIDEENHRIIKEGQEIVLPKKEFQLLLFLSSSPGKVFKREIILEKVWGNEVVVGSRTIDVHIRKLREKLGEDCIKTIKGIGYKFEF